MTRSSSGRGDTPATNDSKPDSYKPSRTITTIKPAFRHAGETSRRRDVRVGVHLQQPRPSRLIDAEVAAAISFASHHIPGSPRNHRDLVGEILGEIGWAVWFGAEVFVAARLPLRAIRN